jgi:hypothetical protein
MREYHLYCIDHKNHIRSRHSFVLVDDLAALDAGKKLCGEYEIEAWEGTRLVARLAKDGTASLQPASGPRAFVEPPARSRAAAGSSG